VVDNKKQYGRHYPEFAVSQQPDKTVQLFQRPLTRISYPIWPRAGAAFDTVDHEILLQRLKQTFGLTGTLLAWLRLY
jgi:hypothetical protein